MARKRLSVWLCHRWLNAGSEVRSYRRFMKILFHQENEKSAYVNEDGATSPATSEGKVIDTQHP